MPTFSVARATLIDAPHERVHALINDFREWEAWSPWEDLDPNMQHTYSGAESGVGAKHEWTGNKDAGEGSMEITHSEPERIDIDLRFIKPWKAENDIVFHVIPASLTPGDHQEATEVTWTMTGQQNAFTKLIFTLMNMEKKLAADFDKGLARLKTVAEE